jgi:hypothetical protein
MTTACSGGGYFTAHGVFTRRDDVRGRPSGHDDVMTRGATAASCADGMAGPQPRTHQQP